MQANHTSKPAPPKPWKHPKGGNRGLQQAYMFRDLAANQAMELMSCSQEELDAALARAKALQANSVVWSDASDRIRILRGKPLPGSLRPERKPSKKKQVSLAPTEEPINPAQAKSTGSATSELKESLSREQPSPPSTPLTP